MDFSKDKGIINELRTIFETLIDNNRFYSNQLLNMVLELKGEKILNY